MFFQYNYQANEFSYLYHPNWEKLKGLIIALFLVLLVFFVLSMYIASHLYAKSQVQKSISKTSRMLHSYMHHDIDSNDVFPPAYAEVATQIVQIKSTMQRHEQAIKEETARRNDLITYLAHDLKTPLARMRLAIETETATNENLIQDIDRMTEMVNGYLAFARGETPEIEQATELPPMLTRIARDAAGDKEIVTDFPDTPAQFYARPMALARAFSNIIENAARYAKTKIKITEQDDVDTITVTIEDDGIGIPDDRKRDALRPFVRLDDARGTHTGGTGLGLSIAQTAIENHGGQIFLEDSEMGGLRVRVVLPI